MLSAVSSPSGFLLLRIPQALCHLYRNIKNNVTQNMHIPLKFTVLLWGIGTQAACCSLYAMSGLYLNAAVSDVIQETNYYLLTSYNKMQIDHHFLKKILLLLLV